MKEELFHQFLRRDRRDEFWGIQYNPAEEIDVFTRGDAAGLPAMWGLGYALTIRAMLPGLQVAVHGFHHEDWPGGAHVRNEGGVDFAIVEARWLLDPTLVLVSPTNTRDWGWNLEKGPYWGVFDLDDAADRAWVEKLYGHAPWPLNGHFLSKTPEAPQVN